MQTPSCNVYKAGQAAFGVPLVLLTSSCIHSLLVQGLHSVAASKILNAALHVTPDKPTQKPRIFTHRSYILSDIIALSNTMGWRLALCPDTCTTSDVVSTWQMNTLCTSPPPSPAYKARKRRGLLSAKLKSSSPHRGPAVGWCPVQ